MNKQRDYYKEILEEKFELLCLCGKLNLLNDITDQNYKKKYESIALGMTISSTLAFFGFSKVYKRYGQHLSKSFVKRFLIKGVLPISIFGFIKFWFCSDSNYRELRSILALRYEPQILELYPKLKEAKIKLSFPEQPSPQNNAIDLSRLPIIVQIIISGVCQQLNFNNPDNAELYQKNLRNYLNYLYYKLYIPKPVWPKNNSWNDEMKSIHKDTEFSDSRYELSSQSENPAQLKSNENSDLLSSAKHD